MDSLKKHIVKGYKSGKEIRDFLNGHPKQLKLAQKSAKVMHILEYMQYDIISLKEGLKRLEELK